MIFFVIGIEDKVDLTSFEKENEEFLILTQVQWNDHYKFMTTYSVTHVNKRKKFWLGNIKIGFTKGFSKTIYEKANYLEAPNISGKYTSLKQNFFSIGQDRDYYKNLLDRFNENKRIEILEGLGDISYNLKLYDKVKKLEVTFNSLLKDIAISSVKGEFHRLTNGISKASKYNFSFVPLVNIEQSIDSKLSVSVVPNSLPPSNIHTLIGRNGVGKTYLFKKFIQTILGDKNSNGIFTYNDDDVWVNEQFANLIAVSFSAFDHSYYELKKSYQKNINTFDGTLKFDVIGWDYQANDNSSLFDKSSAMFVDSIERISASGKSITWVKSIEKLYTDPLFKFAEISSIMSKNAEEKSNIFKKLSSGHKIVLLTLTQLVDKIEEKSLILLDEPELHLHPPLLSAFIRVLSDLLIQRNAVAIVATHSPVVLQEVPSNCVSKLTRIPGEDALFFHRPDIETFGNNVGTLTSEVFKLEATSSGYFSILNSLVENELSFENIVEKFEGKLASEAQSVLFSLIIDRERKNLS